MLTSPRHQMASSKECPMCGGAMQLRRVEQTVNVPGNPKPTVSVTSEWTCPDCDYFEDAEIEQG